MNKKKVVIIDGYHLLHKGYYGSLKRERVAINRDGILINALYVFVANIFQLIKSNKYYTVIVAFDVGKECWRRELYTNYKATRKETPSDLIPQLNLAREFLSAANIPWYEKDAYEGDDIIGTIARIAVKLDYQVDIISNDKDTYQLVSKNVQIVSQLTKKSEPEIITTNEVFKRFGCKPYQIPDLKALIGDSSDNIKGIRGMRFNTAIKLLNKYGCVENIYNNLNDFTEQQRKKLENNKEQILRNKTITTILKNVSLGRINFKPLNVNYVRFMNFLKKEKMWYFTKIIEEDYKQQLEKWRKNKTSLEKNF